MTSSRAQARTRVDARATYYTHLSPTGRSTRHSVLMALPRDPHISFDIIISESYNLDE